MASKKITEMSVLSSSYINAGYMHFPVVQPNGQGGTENYKLPYNDLVTRMAADLPSSGGFSPMIVKLEPDFVPSGSEDPYTNWGSQEILTSADAAWDPSNKWIQLNNAGIYKVSIVAFLKYVDSYFSQQYWPYGLVEFGSYLLRDSYNPAVLIPPYGYRSVHNRYIPSDSSAYMDRTALTYHDEFLVDYRDNSSSQKGRIQPGAWFMSQTGAYRPMYDLAVTVVRIS